MSGDTLRKREEKDRLLAELTKSQISCDCVFHIAVPSERRKKGFSYEITATVVTGGFLTSKRKFSLIISVPDHANEFVRDLRQGRKIHVKGTVDEGNYMLSPRWDYTFDDEGSYRKIQIEASNIQRA